MVDPGSIGGAGLGRAIGGGAAKVIVGRRAAKYIAMGAAEVSLRVVDGAQDGLKTSWRHGLAGLWSGGLDFASAVGGFRPWRRASVTIIVREIVASAPRTPTGKDLVSLDAQCRIVQVRTTTAWLELAVAPPYQLEWVLHRIAPASGTLGR